MNFEIGGKYYPKTSLFRFLTELVNQGKLQNLTNQGAPYIIADTKANQKRERILGGPAYIPVLGPYFETGKGRPYVYCGPDPRDNRKGLFMPMASREPSYKKFVWTKIVDYKELRDKAKPKSPEYKKYDRLLNIFEKANRNSNSAHTIYEDLKEDYDINSIVRSVYCSESIDDINLKINNLSRIEAVQNDWDAPPPIYRLRFAEELKGLIESFGFKKCKFRELDKASARYTAESLEYIIQTVREDVERLLINPAFAEEKSQINDQKLYKEQKELQETRKQEYEEAKREHQSERDAEIQKKQANQQKEKYLVNSRLERMFKARRSDLAANNEIMRQQLDIIKAIQGDMPTMLTVYSIDHANSAPILRKSDIIGHKMLSIPYSFIKEENKLDFVYLDREGKTLVGESCLEPLSVLCRAFQENLYTFDNREHQLTPNVFVIDACMREHLDQGKGKDDEMRIKI